MSMNLTLHDGEREINLWQTPTHITFMCLSSDDYGNPDGGMLGVRKRYLIWVDSHMNGVWNDADDLNAMRENIAEHKEKVMAVKDPRFGFI